MRLSHSVDHPHPLLDGDASDHIRLWGRHCGFWTVGVQAGAEARIYPTGGVYATAPRSMYDIIMLNGHKSPAG